MVKLKLPVVDTSTSGSRSTPGEWSCRACRLLLVEDNAVSRELLKRMLESMGHDVSVAADGIEAMEAINCSQFDAIFTDIRMPRMNGMELAIALREDQRTRTLPLIGLTADAITDHLSRFVEAGLDQVIAKPASMMEVDLVLNMVLSSGRAPDIV